MNTQINQLTNTNKTALAGQASTAVPVLVKQDQYQKQIIWGALLYQLRDFIGAAQMQAMREVLYGEEAEFMQRIVSDMIDLVDSMPVTYDTDGQGNQAIVQLHYFTQGADWFITERDSEEQQLQAFGKADLGYGGELGYISIVELLECGAELDLHWTPKKLSDV